MFIFITFISSKSPCRIDSIRYSVCARDTPFWQEQTDEDSGGWMKSWHCYSLVKWCQMRMDSLHQIKETQKKHRKKGKTIRISKHFKTFCETSGNRQCLEQLRCFSPDLAPIAVWSGRWDLQMGRDCPDSWKVLEGPGRSWKVLERLRVPLSSIHQGFGWFWLHQRDSQVEMGSRCVWT